MFVEDLAPFFVEFGSDATLNAVGVRAIFDNGYTLGSASGIGFASTQPRLILPTASVPANPVGMPVVVDGANFTVAGHEPDGTGSSVLQLELAP